MEDKLYAKLGIFNTPEQKEENLLWFHFYTVFNLSFGHFVDVER